MDPGRPGHHADGDWHHPVHRPPAEGDRIHLRPPHGRAPTSGTLTTRPSGRPLFCHLRRALRGEDAGRLRAPRGDGRRVAFESAVKLGAFLCSVSTSPWASAAASRYLREGPCRPGPLPAVPARGGFGDIATRLGHSERALCVQPSSFCPASFTCWSWRTCGRAICRRRPGYFPAYLLLINLLVLPGGPGRASIRRRS